MKIDATTLLLGGAALFLLMRGSNAVSGGGFGAPSPNAGPTAEPNSTPQTNTSKNQEVAGPTFTPSQMQQLLNSPAGSPNGESGLSLLLDATAQNNLVEMARAQGQIALATGATTQTYVETGGATRYTGPAPSGPIDYQGNPI